jgi:dihydrofolate reductase
METIQVSSTGNKLKQGKLIFDISMSLDGFIAGKNISAEQPMGDSGMRLHDWIFGGKTEIDKKVLDEIVENSGAVIVGGRTYHIAIKDAWNGVSPFTIPAFVLSENVPEKIPAGFTFISSSIETAVTEAKAVAGHKNIWIMGGAATGRQYIQSGLLDEIHIHLIPVLLGEGVPLFDHSSNSKYVELERIEVIESPAATHLKFRVIK